MTLAEFVAFPTLTQIQGWDTGHLEAAADGWTVRAQTWETSYTAVLAGVSNPGGTPWHGAAADAAAQRVCADRRVVTGAVDLLNDAAAAARMGAAEIGTARQVALEKVTATLRAGFHVEDDLSIVDTTTPTRTMRARRVSEAVMHARGVWNAADTLVATDKRVAGQIIAAAKGLQDFRFESAQENEFPHSLLAAYGGQLRPLPAAPHLIYCYPSARPDFWWCEGYDVGGGSYGFDSPFDASGVG